MNAMRAIVDGGDSSDQMIFLQDGAPMVPFTYRFLGLRLRLAFTKRRFKRVEASYQHHLTTNAGGAQQDENALDDLLRLVEASFSSLRTEIDRIEEGQESMTKRALPRVREKINLHQCFIVFLSGFLDRGEEKHEKIRKTGNAYSGCDVDGQDDWDHTSTTEEMSLSSSSSHCSLSSLTELSTTLLAESSEVLPVPADVTTTTTEAIEVRRSDTQKQQQQHKCHLPMLNVGEETAVGIKRLIAEFAGVPTGMLLHDIRSLSTLLNQTQSDDRDDGADLVLVQLDTDTTTQTTTTTKPNDNVSDNDNGNGAES